MTEEFNDFLKSKIEPNVDECVLKLLISYIELEISKSAYENSSKMSSDLEGLKNKYGVR